MAPLWGMNLNLVCAECGAPFAGKTHNAKLCGDECRRVVKNRNQRAYGVKVGREVLNAKCRAYYAEHAESLREYRRDYVAQNLEAVRAANRAYDAANKEARRASRRALYRGRTPEQVQEARDRLRPGGLKKCYGCLSEKGFSEFYRCPEFSPDGLTPYCKACIAERGSSYFRRYLRYWQRNGIRVDVCYICGVAAPSHGDHVIPRALGGPTTGANMMPACAPCNLSKSDTPLDVYLLARNASRV